jgi:hypothetical protein
MTTSCSAPDSSNIRTTAEARLTRWGGLLLSQQDSAALQRVEAAGIVNMNRPKMAI